jgi:hypothetical protein
LPLVQDWFCASKVTPVSHPATLFQQLQLLPMLLLPALLLGLLLASRPELPFLALFDGVTDGLH